jgi:hypothetical protein
MASRLGWNMTAAQRSGFIAYMAIAVIAAFVYRSLSPAIEVAATPVGVAPLVKSRGIVVRLATLFSLDAFSGGFVIQSLLALWLFRHLNLYPPFSLPESEGYGRWFIRICRRTRFCFSPR